MVLLEIILLQVQTYKIRPLSLHMRAHTVDKGKTYQDLTAFAIGSIIDLFHVLDNGKFSKIRKKLEKDLV